MAGVPFVPTRRRWHARPGVVFGILALLAIGCTDGDWVAPLSVRREISGQIVDATTGAPISGAFVVVHVFSTSLRDASVHTTRDVLWTQTHPDGRFFFHGVVHLLFPFNLRWETRLEVVAPAYEPSRAEVATVSPTLVRIAMAKTPSPLDRRRLVDQCDLLWPAYEARSACERLVATVRTAANPNSTSSSGSRLAPD